MGGKKPDGWSNQKAAEKVLGEVSQNLHILSLVRGYRTNGKPGYAYILIPCDRYEAFKAAEARGCYDLGEFGHVVAHGDGLEPPAEVKHAMQEQYGAQEDFIESLETISDALIALNPKKD